MRREWEPEDLVAAWTLVDPDWVLISNKTGATRLGFALLLKFFEIEARFPRSAADVPASAVTGYFCRLRRLRLARAAFIVKAL